MKKVLFFCGGTKVPASRFRVLPIAKGLRERGWDVEIDFGYGDADQSISNMKLKKAYRILRRILRAYRTMFKRFEGPVVIQRLSIPTFALPEIVLGKRNGMLVFDFDDAIFLDSKGEKDGLRHRAFNGVCKVATHVVAGNFWLAGKVPLGTEVTVVPTCIDTQAYLPKSQAEERKTLRIGWIGTSSNLINLRVLIEPLRRLREAGHSFEFVLCSDVLDSELIDALQAKFQKWSASEELEFLQSLNIGLMPLFDTDWSKGKCSFKMIQYMSVGCPVVGSAVGMNKDVMKDDVGGFLVTDDDWYTPLAKLLSFPNLRLECGRQARERAVALYDVAVAVDAYDTILTAQLDRVKNN